MDQVNKICKLTLKLKDEEVAELRETFKGQENYISPLKMATQTKQNKLGKYNNLILDKVVELKKLIESGADLG